jgi:hypothetical protein
VRRDLDGHGAHDVTGGRSPLVLAGTVKEFYSLYTDVDFYDAEDCAFCTRMKQTIQGPGTTAMRKLLDSEHVDTGIFTSTNRPVTKVKRFLASARKLSAKIFPFSSVLIISEVRIPLL